MANCLRPIVDDDGQIVIVDDNNEAIDFVLSVEIIKAHEGLTKCTVVFYAAKDGQRIPPRGGISERCGSAQSQKLKEILAKGAAAMWEELPGAGKVATRAPGDQFIRDGRVVTLGPDDVNLDRSIVG